MVNLSVVYGCSNHSNHDKLSYYCLPSVICVKWKWLEIGMIIPGKNDNKSSIKELNLTS